MNLYNIYMDIRSHSVETAILLAILLKLIDIAPIKINPWNALLKGIQHFFVGGVNERIDDIEKKQNEFQDTLNNVNDLMRSRMSDIDELTGKKFKNFESKLDEVAKSQKELSKSQDETKMSTSRYRIIRAADEIRAGKVLSKDHMEQLGEDAEIYVSYCNTHPEFKNHKGKQSLNLFLEYESNALRKEVQESYKKGV